MMETYGLNIYGIKILTEAGGGLCRPIGMIHRQSPLCFLEGERKLRSIECVTCQLTTAFRGV